MVLNNKSGLKFERVVLNNIIHQRSNTITNLFMYKNGILFHIGNNVNKKGAMTLSDVNIKDLQIYVTRPKEMH